MKRGGDRLPVEALFPLLMEILLEHRDGIGEYDLLCELEKHDALGDTGESDLALFRNHFFLFHTLYRLRDFLRDEKSWELKIFCLDIRLQPYCGGPASGSETCPAPADPLRAYYLDLAHMEEVRAEDVCRMLDDFDRRFSAYINCAQELSLLGLPPDAAPETVRRRCRTLAFQNHPDRGGSPEAFSRISTAMERLRLAGRWEA